MTSAAHQRLFVAVTPSDDALEHLDAELTPMRTARPDLRWISTRLLHVTLAFMPEVEHAVADELPAALALVAADATPLRLSLTGSGLFGDRVLWAGIDGDTTSLLNLADRVLRSVTTSGALPRRDTFRPHLTVARRAGHLDAHLEGLAAQLDGYVGPTWQADELHLIRSYLGRSVRHETVATMALSGGP